MRVFLILGVIISILFSGVEKIEHPKQISLGKAMLLDGINKGQLLSQEDFQKMLVAQEKKEKKEKAKVVAKKRKEQQKREAKRKKLEKIYKAKMKKKLLAKEISLATLKPFTFFEKHKDTSIKAFLKAYKSNKAKFTQIELKMVQATIVNSFSKIPDFDIEFFKSVNKEIFNDKYVEAAIRDFSFEFESKKVSYPFALYSEAQLREIEKNKQYFFGAK